jgi:hypothetical protein
MIRRSFDRKGNLVRPIESPSRIPLRFQSLRNAFGGGRGQKPSMRPGPEWLDAMYPNSKSVDGTPCSDLIGAKAETKIINVTEFDGPNPPPSPLATEDRRAILRHDLDG